MVIACIGTPTISGDSIAPMVGDLLISKGVQAHVYGTTARPITAINYNEYLASITAHHKGEAIIAVDSALGKPEDIGMIKIVRGGVCPGGALKRNLTKIGTIGILAQIGDSNGNVLNELMNVPYTLAFSTAKRLVKLILKLIG